MSAPREIIQSHPPEWDQAAPPPAAAWLLGYVRTDAPGYREFICGSTLYTVASGEYRFDALLAAMNTAIGGGDTVTAWAAWGAFDDGSTTAAISSHPDRLGWLIGAGREAGDTGTANARFVPPAGIPLIGATWKQVVDDADRRQLIDRHRRNQGYVWGSALLWRCSLVMHRYALEALQTGWCLRGKVTLGCADMLDTPISSTEPRGAITGYALGLDSVSWLDSIQQNARVEMTIVTQ